MKFRLGPPQATHDDLVNSTPVLDTSAVKMFPLAMGLGLIPCLCTYLLCLTLADNRTIFFWLDQPIWIFIGLFALVLVVHEATHLLVSPGCGTHPSNVLGFDKSVCAPYVNVDAPMGKKMALAHALAPTVVLTPMFLLACALTSVDIQGAFAMLAVINAGGVGGDWIMAWRMARAMDIDDQYQSGYYGKPKPILMASIREL